MHTQQTLHHRQNKPDEGVVIAVFLDIRGLLPSRPLQSLEDEPESAKGLYQSICFIIFAGTPPTMVFVSTSFVTTAPAATMDLL